MYKNIHVILIIICTCYCSLVTATDFTISSYNCGGLSDHYDYLRAACMQKLMQERYIAEPGKMALNEKIQKLALKILFTKNHKERSLAQQEWNQKGYQKILKNLIAAPTGPHSPNYEWFQKANAMISSYHVRPVELFDEEVNGILEDHLKDLAKDENFSSLTESRSIMATRIFQYDLKQDIVCLQEADYLDKSMFPEHYEVILSSTSHSKNGVAWNRGRFDLIKTIGNIKDKAFAVQLKDKETGRTILVASGHISGCNPYTVVKDPETGKSDSAKGDNELKAIVELFDAEEADIKIIGMDSNVTSLHPRLKILKSAGYHLDYENFLEPTCTNPYQVLNTRIDWITLKSGKEVSASIVNIPVLGIGLNSIRTNMSDHKPVAAKIRYL